MFKISDAALFVFSPWGRRLWLILISHRNREGLFHTSIFIINTTTGIITVIMSTVINHENNKYYWQRRV